MCLRVLVHSHHFLVEETVEKKKQNLCMLLQYYTWFCRGLWQHVLGLCNYNREKFLYPQNCHIKKCLCLRKIKFSTVGCFGWNILILLMVGFHIIELEKNFKFKSKSSISLHFPLAISLTFMKYFFLPCFYKQQQKKKTCISSNSQIFPEGHKFGVKNCDGSISLLAV